MSPCLSLEQRGCDCWSWCSSLAAQGNCLSENRANLRERSTDMERETRSSLVKLPEPLNQTTPETSPILWFITVIRDINSLVLNPVWIGLSLTCPRKITDWIKNHCPQRIPCLEWEADKHIYRTHNGSFSVDTKDGSESSRHCGRGGGHSFLKKEGGLAEDLREGKTEWRAAQSAFGNVPSHSQPYPTSQLLPSLLPAFS